MNSSSWYNFKKTNRKIMNTHVLKLTEFVRNYKDASNKDEEAAAIFDLIQESQSQKKEELLKEIKLEDIASKQDLKALEMTLKAEIERSKSSTIIWLCGFIVAWTGVLSALFFHFSK